MSASGGLTRRGLVGLAAALAAAPTAFANQLAQASRASRNADVFTSTGSNSVPRYLHAAVDLGNGLVMVSGGYTVSEAIRRQVFALPTASVQIYNLNEDAWYDIAPMNVARARHSMCLLANGTVAVVGGMNANPLSSIEVYDPSVGQWQMAGVMNAPIYDHAASAVGDRIVITGGQEGRAATVLTLPTGRRTAI